MVLLLRSLQLTMSSRDTHDIGLASQRVMPPPQVPDWLPDYPEVKPPATCADARMLMPSVVLRHLRPESSRQMRCALCYRVVRKQC